MKNKYNQYGGYIDINDYKTYGSYINSSEYFKEIFDYVEHIETREEKEIRLAKEKAEARNNKIDKILGL
jgi:hypothetical protein